MVVKMVVRPIFLGALIGVFGDCGTMWANGRSGSMRRRQPVCRRPDRELSGTSGFACAFAVLTAAVRVSMS